MDGSDCVDEEGNIGGVEGCVQNGSDGAEEGLDVSGA